MPREVNLPNLQSSSRISVTRISLARFTFREKIENVIRNLTFSVLVGIINFLCQIPDHFYKICNNVQH